MSPLPVITALGGINPAGRSSCHHGFNRLIHDALPPVEQQHTLKALAALTGQKASARLLDDTLVRRLESSYFNADQMPVAVNARSEHPLTLELRQMDLPDPLPQGWTVTPINRQRCRVQIAAGAELLIPAGQKSRVQSAGQLPTGFDPAALYPSRNHPRALQMAIYGASDALGMLGLDWDQVRNQVAPHQIGVYASNLMGQLDDQGLGGMMKFPSQGRRITSKQCPLGLGEMTADFVNAYVLGLAGSTGGMLGACATFLYNLLLGVNDIRAGRRRIVVVGTSEAPLVPEVIEGYRSMGALGEDEALMKLDDDRDTPDHRRACRPFGFNVGFTIGESAQFVVLMDDQLALELGANILGAVPDVFVHADGTKKSISAPGIGNYLTLARAANLTRQLIGEQGLRHHSFVHAHGTGTPQNRVTESNVFERVAEAFGIQSWPIAAIKCYLGHSLGSAGGDQLAASLGTFSTGVLPGIFTLDQLAPDVHHRHLAFSQKHRSLEQPKAALLNSKGFGGNNATAVLLSPDVTLEHLSRRHDPAVLNAWRDRVQSTQASISRYDEQSLRGQTRPVYRFGEGVLDGDDLEISDRQIRVPGWEHPLTLDEDPDFSDF